jgi:hypothetical protein
MIRAASLLGLILAILVAPAVCRAEEDVKGPFVVVFLFDDSMANNLTLLAIDRSYHLRYMVVSTRKGDVHEWAAMPNSGFALKGKPANPIRAENLAVMVELSPFSVRARSTNVGYSFSFHRAGALVQADEVKFNVVDQADPKAVIAIFTLNDLGLLPRNEEEMSSFDAQKIRALIAEGKASLGPKEGAVIP